MEKYLKLINDLYQVSDNQRILDIYNKILTEEEEYRRILNEKDNVKGINAFD